MPPSWLLRDLLSQALDGLMQPISNGSRRDIEVLRDFRTIHAQAIAHLKDIPMPLRDESDHLVVRGKSGSAIFSAQLCRQLLTEVQLPLVRPLFIEESIAEYPLQPRLLLILIHVLELL